MAELGLAELGAGCGYPVTRLISAWQSIATLLLAKCARRARVHHLGALVDDLGLAAALGLTALPKATHLGSYSYRVRRESKQKLLTGLVRALRTLGLAHRRGRVRTRRLNPLITPYGRVWNPTRGHSRSTPGPVSRLRVSRTFPPWRATRSQSTVS